MITPEHKALVATVTKWLDGGCNSWGLPSGEIRKLCAAIESLSAQCAQPQAGEPVADEREWCKLYHSRWPTEDLLKAREPGGLITDDGEAWKYHYTHSDAQGGPYDLVYRPVASAQPALAVKVVASRELAIWDAIQRRYWSWKNAGAEDEDAMLRDLARFAAIGAGGQAAVDERTERKIDLWFFRDLSDEQRLSLFSIFGFPIHEIDRVHGHQRKALRRILSALSQPHPADERVVEALRKGWEYGRKSWCPAGILADTDRTERDWTNALAALAQEGQKNG